MNNKNKEIEIKLSFKNKKDVLAKLGKKAEFVKKVNVHDIYYGLEDTQMKNSKNIIRVREIKNGKSELTFKSKVEDKNNIWHRIELTTEISSAQTLDKIFSHIGVKKIYEYESEKEYYNFLGMEIVFAKFTLPTLLEFMEIEGDLETDIRRVVNKLGSSVQEVGEGFFNIFDKARG